MASHGSSSKDTMKSAAAGEPLFAGLDGGGTGCRARLVDASGQVLAEAGGGPANLYQQGTAALRSVEQCIQQLLQNAGLEPSAQARLHAGLGMAGAELPSSQRLLADWNPPWASVEVVNDAHIACLGAHEGGDGGLVIIGTGIVAWAIQGGQGRILDGWGFPLADRGSGAWLGQRALQQALRASDGILDHSPLTRALLQAYDGTPRAITEWAATATSGDYAGHAREVVAHAEAGDPVATALLKEQADEVSVLIERLCDLQATPVALLGGLASTVQARLPARLAQWLSPARRDAISGALYLIKRTTRSND